MDITINIPDDLPQDKLIYFNNLINEAKKKIIFYNAIKTVSFVSTADYTVQGTGNILLELTFTNEPSKVQRCIENAVNNMLYETVFSVFKIDNGYKMVIDGVDNLTELAALLDQTI